MITAPSSDFDPSWPAHEGEARLLAALLRTSRLTLLYCEAGTDKTAFVHSALMPLLRRRAGDRFAPAAVRESGVVVPFPDRRRRPAGNGSKRKREFVVHFDHWTGAPLPALLAGIHQAANTSAAERDAPWQRLGDALDALSIRLDASFIILFDRFEEFLLAPTDREGRAEFINEWIETLHRPQLPANFLIAVNDDVRPRLDSLRSRIPGFDDFSLKLTRPPVPKAAIPPAPPEPTFAPLVIDPPVLTETLTPPDAISTSTVNPTPAPEAPVRVRRPKVKRPEQPRFEVKTRDVYALIEATLARTVTEVSKDPFPERAEPIEPTRAMAPEAPAPVRLMDPLPLAALPQRAGGLLAWIARLLRRPPKPR